MTTPLEPKTIDHPGAGKIREQTLDEFLSVLAPEHLARQQLNEIRSQALKSVEFSTQLMQANEKIIELQGKLMVTTPKFVEHEHEIHAPPNTYQPASDLLPIGQTAPERQDPNFGQSPKAECPNCKQLVSTSAGAWASHQRNKHPENPAPRPTV